MKDCWDRDDRYCNISRRDCWPVERDFAYPKIGLLACGKYRYLDQYNKIRTVA